jgi:cell division protein FtsL
VTAQAAQGKRKSKKERKRKLVNLTEAQAVLSWAVLLALAFLLGAIYLFQTSEIASVGRHVQKMQNQLDETKQANVELEQKIAEAQSLERLQEEAARLGFIKAAPQDVEYLVIPDFPGEAEWEMATETTDTTVPVQTIGEALWLVLQSGIGGLMRGESQ